MQRVIIAPLLCIAITMLAPRLGLAENPATQPASQPTAIPAGSPRAAVKAFNDALPPGGMKAARAAYHAANDKERAAARSLAKADLAGALVVERVKTKFGSEAVVDFIHALRLPTDDDLARATDNIDNDHATITFDDPARDPLEMVKVDGKWKISVADLAAGEDGVADVIRTNDALAESLNQLVQRMDAGEYANAYLLERAVRQRMFRVLGDED